MSWWWAMPLAVAAIGATASAVLARRLQVSARETEELASALASARARPAARDGSGVAGMGSSGAR